MWARHRLEWFTAVGAATLGVVYLLLPPMGSDLAAQQARADFFARHGYTPVDLRWYAGVDQLGYSLTSQPVMAVLGVRVTGALSLVAASVLFALLLRRTAAPRPLLGAVVGTFCIAGNLVSGRVTYGLGVALGLAALLALTSPRRRWLPPALALLAGLTSPVAALFTGLCGVALALSARRLPTAKTAAPAPPATTPVAVTAGASPRAAANPETPASQAAASSGPLLADRVHAGLLLAVPAGLPLALNALLFGDGGWMNISRTDTVRAVVAALVVAALVPRRPVRIGGVLAALGVLAAALIHTPVGLNATRLAVMFTLPLLAAYAALPLRGNARPTSEQRRTGLSPSGDARPTSEQRRTGLSPSGDSRPASEQRRLRLPRPSGSRLPSWAVVGLVIVAGWWQPPVVTGDLRDIGNPTADASYFRPLLDRLAQEQLTGRVEIPATRAYWEAAHMGDVPLARGWLRQADIDRNPLFFTEIPGAAGTGVPLTADTYRSWLDELAVQFVAVPGAELTWSGRPEAELVTSGLPYLREVWANSDWRLFAVTGARPIVAAPAVLTGQDAASLTFSAPAAGDFPVRVRWNRWLRASNGASLRRDGDWLVVRVPGPGRYTVSS